MDVQAKRVEQQVEKTRNLVEGLRKHLAAGKGCISVPAIEGRGYRDTDGTLHGLKRAIRVFLLCASVDYFCTTLRTVPSE